MFCRDGDDQSLNPTSYFWCFFGEGAMRQTRGMLREHPLFFWQFVNDAHGTSGWLKRVVWLGRQHLRRIRPLVDGHSLPLFLPVSGRSTAGVHDFSRRFSHSLSLDIWTTVDWSSNEGHWPLGVRSPGAFFVFPSAPGGESPAKGSTARNAGYAAMS